VLILGILLVMTRVQVRYWRDSLSLYEHTLAVTRNNYVIQINYANLLKKAGQLDDAIEHYRRAAEINRNEALIHNNLGYALREKGMIADAASAFSRSLEIKLSADIYSEYGVMLAEQGKYDAAIAQFNGALDIDPDFPGALHNMYRAGVKGGKIDEVLGIMRDRELKTPRNAELYYRAGMLYGIKGETEAAIEQLESAVRLRPDYIAARGELGDAFLRAGHSLKAAEQYESIVRLAPDNVKALCVYSLLLATSPDKDVRDPQRAWSLADKACGLTDYNQPEPLDVLSQACAARGEMTLAIETAQKALKAATAGGEDELAGQIKSRLELYQQKWQEK
jgi:tetratricopeptide (TPR) repeat protein